jgi:hypothetical protein
MSSNIDFNRNDLRQGIDTGIKTSVAWFFTTKENNNLLYPDWKSPADDLWQGETDIGITFEMMRERPADEVTLEMYCLNVYFTVYFGKEDEYQLDLTDYIFVDTLEDGYRMAEQIYQALKRVV